MMISQMVKFLSEIQETEGDLKVESITGFWVRAVPATGERVVVCSVGDRQSIEDVLTKTKL